MRKIVDSNIKNKNNIRYHNKLFWLWLQLFMETTSDLMLKLMSYKNIKTFCAYLPIFCAATALVKKKGDINVKEYNLTDKILFLFFKSY